MSIWVWCMLVQHLLQQQHKEPPQRLTRLKKQTIVKPKNMKRQKNP